MNPALNGRASKSKPPPSRAKNSECPLPAKAGNCSFEARGFSPVSSEIGDTPVYKSGLALVVLGLLAEMPQGLASMGIVGTLHPGLLPGSGATQDLACAGFVLCACGLYRMLRAKGRPGWIALLGIVGIPGALAGLAVVSLLKRTSMTRAS